jgi:BirA family biotin operon repressor/biotin-[acetyl-CoA-carboxylase] ligase
VNQPAGEASTDWLWRIQHVHQIGSTNDELLAQRQSGEAPVGSVLVSDQQLAGKGRLGRSWLAEPGQALLMSVVLPLPADPRRWGLTPLAVGVALVRAIERQSGHRQPSVGPEGVVMTAIDKDQTGRPLLKWPNDVMVVDRKLAGILVEAHDGVAICGIGLNVCQDQASLGELAAVSLAMLGLQTSPLLMADLLMAELRDVWATLLADDDQLINQYRRLSATIGQEVMVELSSTQQLRGLAVDVTNDGRLIVDEAGQRHLLASGDVHHLRSLKASR